MTGRSPLLRGAAAPLVVAAVVVVNLWSLRASRLPVAYLNDSALHEQMVRYATAAFQAGRDPLSGWYPYLNLGSPQFLHYQSLGAIVTGLVGLAVGAEVAFRWSLWLLLGCWPVVIYLSARIFGLGRWVAVAAAAVTPLIASVPAAGYEPDAYVWVGYGLWAQLCGSWALPFAWATTWRATTDRRFILPAGLTVAATVTLHYETGYLAIMGVVLMPFLVRTGLRDRLVRATGVLLTAVLAAAWTLVPLLVYARYAAINQALEGGPLENGYGAHQVLSWLFTGGVYDGVGWPVVTLAVLAGLVVAIRQWRREPMGRALLVLGIASLLLCFGRTTFGVLTDVVPASHDLFFRRFMMGAQLAGIYLAGRGIVAVGRLLAAGVTRGVLALGAASSHHLPASREVSPGLRAGAVSAAVVLIGLGLLPSVHAANHLADRNATAIADQGIEARTQAPQIDTLLDYVDVRGGGRVYAGSPNNWGNTFDVGQVQVYKYLASLNVDETGFTLRTAALMSQPEYQFDDTNPSDYQLFGIRYLILPAGMTSPVPADSVMQRGHYHLWQIPANGYVSVVDTIGSLVADRGDVGTRSIPYLESDDFAEHEDLTVAWDGDKAAPATLPGGAAAPTAPGQVLSTQADLVAGRVATTVRTDRRSVVVLSASYDPGWQVTVDGHRAATEILDPAVVGVVVGPGTHRIVFAYHGYPHYDAMWGLLGVGVLVGAGLSFIPIRRRRQRADRQRTGRQWRARYASGSLQP
jgi:Bacterial membrane protein YfhO